MRQTLSVCFLDNFPTVRGACFRLAGVKDPSQTHYCSYKALIGYQTSAACKHTVRRACVSCIDVMTVLGELFCGRLCIDQHEGLHTPNGLKANMQLRRSWRVYLRL